MGCLSKISQAIAFDCVTSNGLVQAVMINRDDVMSWSLTGDEVSAITLVGGGKGVQIATTKRSLIASETLRVNDIAPNGFTHELTVAVFDQKLYASIANQLANGSVIVLTKAAAGTDFVYRAYGMEWGLVATSSTRTSHDNGGVGTFTMSTPEGVVGEDTLTVKNTLFDTLYNGAIV